MLSLTEYLADANLPRGNAHTRNSAGHCAAKVLAPGAPCGKITSPNTQPTTSS